MNASTLDLLRSYVDSYVKPVVKEEPVVVDVKEDPVVSAPVVPEDRCTGLGCKKKGKWDCAHKMCFPCCAAVKEANPECEICTGHLAIYKKIQEENRLIEMGLSGGSRAKTKFYHFEEKFMNHGETVVVWCLRDFCNNPNFSSETFDQYKRQERSRNLLLKLGKTDDIEDDRTTTMSSPGRGMKRSNNDCSSSTLNSPSVTSPEVKSPTVASPVKGNKRGRTSRGTASESTHVIKSESSSTLESGAAVGMSVDEVGRAEVTPTSEQSGIGCGLF